ncbi:hypothetical protein [Desulfuromonas sp. TF]|uniref:hypothetical protein n=1 Tax=Desulfuromonas sp. TF TaxID=1232410 RepID=UPI0012DC1655|nr:hypothetical protein [Desulfuromonas sp. TF]
MKNAHLRRCPHPSSTTYLPGTPYSSGLQAPCIWTFLISLKTRVFQHPARGNGTQRIEIRRLKKKNQDPELSILTPEFPGLS